MNEIVKAAVERDARSREVVQVATCLASDGHDPNNDYDRALAEMTVDLLGLSQEEHKQDVLDLIRG